MIEIRKIDREEDLNQAFLVRRVVFMDEQHVSEEEEFDQFEEESVHFLALYEHIPCGAARWRQTDEGVKLERFAVLEAFRGKGIGKELVSAVLKDAKTATGNDDITFYLNAQLDAVGLYDQFGFVPVGDVFLECDIKHQRMELTQ